MRRRLLLLAMVVVLAVAPTYAVAAAKPARHRPVTNHAPSGPPLSGGGAGDGAAVPGEGEQTAGIQSAAGDQLVENGLASPLCKWRIAGTLSGQAQADCRTSGFVGAPAPTNDYALFCLGRSMQMLGRHAEARKPLALAATMNPERSDYRVYRERSMDAAERARTPQDDAA